MYEKFENFISHALMVMMGFVVVLSMLELAIQIVMYIVNSDGFMLEFKEFLVIFGYFLLILIALELMSSVRIRQHNQQAKIEVMFLIAITAIARKIILMDSKTVEPMYMLGLAALIVVLSTGFYLVKKSTWTQTRNSLQNMPD